MRKDKILFLKEANRMLEMSGVNPISGKDLLVVDIQPEYQDSITFLYEFITFLNNNYQSLNRLTFFFNGEETLGMIPENEYKWWWMENGLDEEVLEYAHFYDKGYAFFRYCIDEGIEDESVSNLVRYMMANDVNDSRELDEAFWDGYVNKYGDEDVRELLEFAGDCINIPDLMDELRRYDNIVVCGGGVNECLKEVEIALDALHKPFNVLTQYTY